MSRQLLQNLFLKLLILPIALMFCGPPTYKLWKYVEHRQASVATRAEVVRVVDGVFTRPVLRFNDQQGVEHQFKSEIPFYFLWAPSVGDHLTVHYLAGHPKIVKTKSFIHYVFYPLLFMLAGVILLIASLFIARSPSQQDVSSD